jgi:predicted Zn-dependent protease
LYGLLAVALIGVFFAEAYAQSNVYDKFRDRTYSNEGYLSEEDELKLADEVHKEILKQVRLVDDRRINDYINSLGQNLARRSQRPNIPWKFYVVDDNAINAFATLGGRVYVHTGLIAVTSNEAQLASVIGHEIGHIVGRHGLENVKRAQKYGIAAVGAQVLGAILGGQTGASIGELAGNIVAGGFLMKHSREAEREADFLGLYNIERSGYNTIGMVQMFEMLQEVSRSNPNAFGSILASHPNPSERAANTRREIDDRLRGSDRRGNLGNSSDYQRIKSGMPASSAPGAAPTSNRRKVRPRP